MKSFLHSHISEVSRHKAHSFISINNSQKASFLSWCHTRWGVVCAWLSVLASALANVSAEKLLFFFFLSLLVQVDLCKWTTLMAGTHTHSGAALARRGTGEEHSPWREAPHHHFSVQYCSFVATFIMCHMTGSLV